MLRSILVLLLGLLNLLVRGLVFLLLSRLLFSLGVLIHDPLVVVPYVGFLGILCLLLEVSLLCVECLVQLPQLFFFLRQIV